MMEWDFEELFTKRDDGMDNVGAVELDDKEYEKIMHELIYEDGLTSIDLILHTQAQWAENPMYGIDKLIDMFWVTAEEVIDAFGDRILSEDIYHAHYSPDDYGHQELFSDYNISGFLAKCTFRVPCNFEFVYGSWDDPCDFSCSDFEVSSEVVSFCAFGETFLKLLEAIYARDRELYKKYESKALQKYEKGGKDD